MYKLLFVLMFVMPVAVSAQDLPDSLIARKVEIGTYADGSKITGNQYSIAPYNITRYEYDANEKLLFIYLKLPKDSLRYRMGIHIVCFDVPSKRKVWDQHFALMNMDFRSLKESEYELKLSRHIIVYQQEGKTNILDAHTGRKMYVIPRACNYVNIEKDIAVTNDGIGYRISTGEQLWKIQFDNAYSWRSIRSPDSNSIVFVSEGLRYINLQNGTTWFRGLSTIKGNTAGMCSAILADSDSYYLSGRKEIIKVHKDGYELWRSPLPEEKTGVSDLYDMGDTLVILNWGYGILMGNMVGAATPYIASFSKKDGSLLSKIKLNTNGPVLSSRISDDTLAIRFTDGIGIYKMSTNTQLAYQKTISEVYKGFYVFAPDEDMEVKKAGSENINLYGQYPRHYFLINDEGKILHLDERLQKVSYIPRNQCIINHLYSDGYRFINEGLKTSIIKGDKKLAILNMTPYKTEGRTIIYTKKEVFILAELPE